MKICLACSAGGHLNEMLQLKKIYSKHKHYFLTFKRTDTESLSKKEKIYFTKRPGRNIINFLINFYQSLKIFLKEKPDLIISTGADVTLNTCIIGKIFGKKIIFIESFCRTNTPSITGKICYLFSDLFIVQWKEMMKIYPKAKYGGSIF